jgi:hypothetical protein
MAAPRAARQTSRIFCRTITTGHAPSTVQTRWEMRNEKKEGCYMGMQYEFDFVDPGGLKAQETLVAVRSQMSRLDRISQMVANRNAPVGEISRAIAAEIANVIKLMTPTVRPLGRRFSTQQELNNQVRGYRQLQRTLIEAEACSMSDTLNMDGPIFKFVLGRIIELFRQAMEDAGVNDQSVRTIMAQFDGLITASERYCGGT